KVAGAHPEHAQREIRVGGVRSGPLTFGNNHGPRRRPGAMSMILLMEILTQAKAASPARSLLTMNLIYVREFHGTMPWRHSLRQMAVGLDGCDGSPVPSVLPLDSLASRSRSASRHGVTWTTARLGICWGVGCRNRNRLKRAGPGGDGRLDSW